MSLTADCTATPEKLFLHNLSFIVFSVVVWVMREMYFFIIYNGIIIEKL